MDKHEIEGDEPAVDGMCIAVRIRRDFTVTDARLLLAAARAAYVDLHPGASGLEAQEMVTSASDAMFTLMERDGLLGDVINTALARHSDQGLQAADWRAQVTVNEPRPLPPGPDCFDRGDVFALPAGRET